MILWKTQKLKNALINETLQEREKFKYLLFTFVIGAITGQFPAETQIDGFFWAETFGLIAITVLGIFYCFDANEQGDGRNFLERFICLSVPVTIRLLSVLMFVGIIAGIVLAINNKEFTDTTASNFGNIIIIIIIQAIFFWRVRSHIKEVSRKEL